MNWLLVYARSVVRVAVADLTRLIELCSFLRRELTYYAAKRVNSSISYGGEYFPGYMN